MEPQSAVHLNVLDGGVFCQPVGQRRRPLSRDSVEADVQVGEGVVDAQSFREAEGSLVAHPVSGEAQPPQLLRGSKTGLTWEGWCRGGLSGFPLTALNLPGYPTPLVNEARHIIV